MYIKHKNVLQFRLIINDVGVEVVSKQLILLL